jgi:hypothetical protein
MSFFVYLFRGIFLLWYLVSPAYRRSTNERWRKTRRYKLIYEIGTGIIGLIIIGALLALVIQRLFFLNY